MSRGLPSMTALLGLLAIAGYQNRDKLSEMLGGHGANPGGAPDQQPQPGQQAQQPGGLGGILGGLGGVGVGGLLGKGLGELMDTFKRSGHGDVADSWVGSGPNKEVTPQQLEQAIGPDVLASLAQQTGLSREDILARLSKELPHAVDQYTPDGQMPTDRDAQRT